MNEKKENVKRPVSGSTSHSSTVQNGGQRREAPRSREGYRPGGYDRQAQRRGTSTETQEGKRRQSEIRTGRPTQTKENSKKEPITVRLKRRMTPKRTVVIAVGVVALAFAVCMLINILIGVRSIEVVGTNLSTDEEIASVAGISTGSGYFSYNTGRSENKVLENIHCISEIKISRSVFGKVKITVTEKKAVWYVEMYGEYYALSDSLEVIRSSDMRDTFINKGLVRLDLPEVKSAILGKTVEYADEDRDCSYIPEFLSDITDSQLYKDGRIDHVDIETKFNNIFVVCDMRYKVKLENHRSTQEKLESVESVIAALQSQVKCEINISNVNAPTVRENPELDFSYLELLLGG